MRGSGTSFWDRADRRRKPSDDHREVIADFLGHVEHGGSVWMFSSDNAAVHLPYTQHLAKGLR